MILQSSDFIAFEATKKPHVSPLEVEGYNRMKNFLHTRLLFRGRKAHARACRALPRARRALPRARRALPRARRALQRARRAQQRARRAHAGPFSKALID